MGAFFLLYLKEGQNSNLF